LRTVIAKRVTTCYYCKDPIEKRSRRLTDYIRIKSNSSPTGWTVIRRHFHFRKDEESSHSCHDIMATEQFKNMPAEVPTSNNPAGRKPLDLTEDQRTERRRLLKRLAAQQRYYIHDGHLDLSSPKYLIEITRSDVRKATRFNRNLEEIMDALRMVGGIPKKYQESVEEQALNTEVLQPQYY